MNSLSMDLEYDILNVDIRDGTWDLTYICTVLRDHKKELDTMVADADARVARCSAEARPDALQKARANALQNALQKALNKSVAE